MRDRGFYVLGLVAAAWLSLGPSPQSLGRPIEIGAPYKLLFDYVPGYDGLRVPARFAMVVVFMLTVLGGYGAATVARMRIGRHALAALAVLFFVEAIHVPFVVNGMTPLRDLTTPEARLYRPARAPGVYHAMARERGDDAVIELPLGQPDYDLRAMYYSIVHRRPLVNGYSGHFPPHYTRLQTALAVEVRDIGRTLPLIAEQANERREDAPRFRAIEIVDEAPNTQGVFHHFMIRVPERDRVRTALASESEHERVASQREQAALSQERVSS